MLGKIEGKGRRGLPRMRWLDRHRLNGHEFEQALGDGEGQGSLACCSPWGHKESGNKCISPFAGGDLLQRDRFPRKPHSCLLSVPHCSLLRAAPGAPAASHLLASAPAALAAKPLPA